MMASMAAVSGKAATSSGEDASKCRAKWARMRAAAALPAGYAGSVIELFQYAGARPAIAF
jgi:hypothetical protein